MAIRIFTIPFDPVNQIFSDEELRKFLLNKHVKRMQTEFFKMDQNAYWTVFIEYDPVLEPHTPGEAIHLDQHQKMLYQRLKQWRNETAEKNGHPPFFIGSNALLMDIAEKAPVTTEALREIKGFGAKKTEKYGKAIIGVIRAFYEKETMKACLKKDEKPLKKPPGGVKQESLFPHDTKTSENGPKNQEGGET